MCRQENQITIHTEKVKLKKHITQIPSGLLWLSIIAFLLKRTQKCFLCMIFIMRIISSEVRKSK